MATSASPPSERESQKSRGGRFLLLESVIGLVAGIISTLTIDIADKYLDTIHNWTTLHYIYFGIAACSAIILFIGIALFWVRGRYPIIYGTTEVVVGVIAAVNAFARADFVMSIDPNITIQILGGIYIIVRGLDNFGKGLKATGLETRWKWLFPQP